jgi:hypothetical protein
MRRVHEDHQMKDEALKLALEALNTPKPTDSYPPLWRSYEKTINDAITAIKQALAAPAVQEREHITDGGQCWCNPDIDYIDPDTGAAVIIHKEPQ